MAKRIPLRRRDGSVRAETIVDDADYEWLNQWRWSLTSWGYAHRRRALSEGKGVVLMHRQILDLGPGDGRQGDHINGNRLDNRRSNLRVVTRAEQQQNLASCRGSTSRYRGVCWDRRRRCWIAYADVAGKRTNLGRFETEEGAAAAAEGFRRKHMPFAIDR